MLQEYDYNLPEELIAKAPVSPRDAARLMVYDRKTGAIEEDIFKNIIKYLPANSVLVFNETKVLPARMFLRKETGGALEVLFVGIARKLIRVMANKSLNSGAKLFLNKSTYFIVEKKDDRFWLLRPSFPIEKVYSVFQKYGVMPIPPYIKDSPLNESEIKKEYQTVFAKNLGSVAAPTAALHFTKKLMADIKKAGHKIIFVTLHVGLGTFAPLTEKNLETGKLHEEYYEIDRLAARELNQLKKSGRRIIAIGTTSLRTLESASDHKGMIQKLSGTTDLFIREGYKFNFVDGIVTNFHVPKSSLMMLVSAFVGLPADPMAGREKLLKLYGEAISRKFRFFSFGDGMLLL